MVTVTGPECTGKSTLAAQLAAWYDAELSPEAARAYAEARRAARTPDTPAEALLGPEDVAPIARAQRAGEDAAADRARASGRRFVVRDTDLVSTVVYARHYYGACPAWVVAAARARRADAYLLCDADVPWEDDGVRDGPLARAALFAAFAAALDEFGAPHVVLRGAPAERLRAAAGAVDRVREGRRA